MKTRITFILALLLLVLTGKAQTEVYLKGNIVPDGSVLLGYQNGQQWQSEVTLDDSRVFLFSDKYVYFECPSAGYRSDNIRINGGTYSVQFNMNTKTWTFEAPVDDYRISAFGSSVCNGQGATGNKGYACLYGEQLLERYNQQLSPSPFYVSGISIGGNNTQQLLDRYAEMTRDHSRYVIVGLSMGNEGIHESANKQQTLNQFSTNMQTIVRRIKADGKVPVVMNNYTRGDFTPEDYSYIKQMNLLIHQWDVASVNTLGAIDDGAGHWASGYQQDNAHPTTNGHKEFFYAMTPSLFDAMAAGKPQPVRDQSQSMVLSKGKRIQFRGEGTIHPFTITIRFKGKAPGRLFAYKTTANNHEGHVLVDANGHVVYNNSTGKTLTTATTLTDGEWHYATLTHYYAQGRTLLYVDKEPADELHERISSMADVFVGDELPTISRELSELFFWRSALSPDEVQALVSGLLLKSSLELYVPMTPALENKAMSQNNVEWADALNTEVWKGSKWISAVNAPVVTGAVNDHENGRSADGASWFVSELTNEGRIKEARWITTALGIYELYVNGQPIGQEVLKPGFTHREKTKRSFTYDITRVLKTKNGQKNQLAVQVTPGWWADKIVTPWGHEGMCGHKCAFRGVLEVTYADGTTRRYGTDLDHWRAGIAGPVKHAGIFDGETYDAREQPGYATPERLSRPEENTEFCGDILPTDGAEVYLRHDLTMKPIRAYVWKEVTNAKENEFGKIVIDREYATDQEMTILPGETLVVDFGQNSAAVPSFVFKAAEGTVLTSLPGELLNDGNGAKSRGMDGPEGSVHRDNLRIPRTGIRLDYTFAAGNQYVSYRPHCTFFGYRFVSITATEPVRIKSVTSVPVTSIAKNLETGILTTGNELVNKLISNTVWGQRSNYLSVPTDCPQRNERLGWTADTQVFAETGSFFANTDRFFHKWMRDMRDTQSPTGGFPGVAPLAQYGGEMMRLGWADAGVIVPWTIWKQFGDTCIVDENWAAMERFMNHVNSTRYDHEQLVKENGNYQWADWLSYEPLESCGGGAFKDGKPLSEAVSYWNYLSACYWAIDAQMMADMAAATHRNATRYRQMVQKAKAYLKEQFLNADGTFKTDILNTMQTPALFALKTGIVEGTARENMISRLRQNFATHDNCLQTGFLGTSILMETLTSNGMADIAYELLFQRRNPSWLYSIDQGATTIWERWNSYMADKGMGPQGMNSFNHYAYGCVCQWLWESAAGIAADPAVPGFRHIIMKPVPDKRLGHIEAEYHSAAGLIKSAWRYNGDQWTWQFTIPKGSTATVTLPGENGTKEYGSGQHKVTLQL